MSNQLKIFFAAANFLDFSYQFRIERSYAKRASLLGLLLSAVLLAVMGSSGMVSCHGFLGMSPCHGLEVKAPCHGPALKDASPRDQCSKPGHVCYCSWQRTCLPSLPPAISIGEISPHGFDLALTPPTFFSPAVYHPPENSSYLLI